MHTLFYSILHFFTDGLCAFAMFSRFSGSPSWYLSILLYDFCAFVLQMPFGAVIDRLKERMPEKAGKLPFFCAPLGGVLTVLGAYTHPVVLGIGNALFHVGGGVGTIEEDRRKGLRGQALGIFVAPGAMGLFLGAWFGKRISRNASLLSCAVTAAIYLLIFLVFEVLSEKRKETMPVSGGKKGGMLSLSFMALLAAALCFIVVVIRSYAGFAVTFSWKTGFLMSFLATAAVVLGKIAGGILAARFGMVRTMTASLILSGVCYWFSGTAVFGILALFFFNMTMPITLYLLAERFRGLEGFSFGLLTVALFLGFLPVYLGYPVPVQPSVLGLIASLAALAMLFSAAVLLKRERGRVS